MIATKAVFEPTPPPAGPSRRGRSLPFAAVLLAALVLAGPSWAQQPERDLASTDVTQAIETDDPRVPTGAVRAYIDACREGDYVTAASFLDLSSLPRETRKQQGPRLARRLKVVLDRKLWVQYELLSEEETGRLDDGLPADLERLGTIENLDILLERVEDDEGRQVWKIASSTVARIPDLYAKFGYGPLGEILPEPLLEISFLQLQLWQWIGLLLLVVSVYLLSWIASWILYRFVRPIVERTQTVIDDRLLANTMSPVRFLVAVALFASGSYLLVLTVPAQEFLNGLARGLAVVVVAWLILRVVDVMSAVFQHRLEQEDRRAAIAALPLGRRIVKTALLAVAAVAMLQNLGFNVTGLIAGLGVGGLAVALAAQKSIANLFGGVSLIADRPVQVGDMCRYGDGKMGTIEEIGIRSTRLRTLDRTLVTIPNSEFSEIQLENFAARDKIRLFATLGLRYETSPDQLRYVLAELKKLLVAHPTVTESPARVRFIGFGAYSLDLEVFAYIETSDWNEFLKIREDIYLRIMDIVEESGSGFAFPSQTLYLGRDGGLDEARVGEAEERVRRWREEGSLPLPDPSEQMIAQWEDTIDYPPRGSVARG